jgi:predicted nucleic acid-binding protein
MNGAPGAPAAAVRAWRLLSDDPRSVYIEAESVSHETRLVGLVSGRESTPDPRTDAWLAALALSLDYELTTFDQGFKSFRGLKLRLLAPAGG